MSDAVWCLAVGVGSYPSLTDGDLSGPPADAADFVHWATQEVDPAQRATRVVHLASPATAPGAEPADLRAMEAFFDAVVSEAVASEARGEGFRAGRRLYVLIAGHGVALERDTYQTVPVLLCGDASPYIVRHFSARLYAEWAQLSACFDEIVYVADHCNRPIKHVPLVPPAYPAQRVDPPGRILVATGAMVGRAAWEKPVAGVVRGVFSHTVMRGLRGAAADEHGVITADGLARWLAPQGAYQVEVLPNPYRDDFEICRPPLAEVALAGPPPLEVLGATGGPHVPAPPPGVLRIACLGGSDAGRARWQLVDAAASPVAHLGQARPLGDVDVLDVPHADRPMALTHTDGLTLTLVPVPGRPLRIVLDLGTSDDPATQVATARIDFGDAPTGRKVLDDAAVALTSGFLPSAPTLRRWSDTVGDAPMARLLLAALGHRRARRHDVQRDDLVLLGELLAQAAAALGDDDVDVRALRGDLRALDRTPRLTQSWRAMVDACARATGSSTDTLLDGDAPTADPFQRYAFDPWLLGRRGRWAADWLAALATVLWPGWDVGAAPPPAPGVDVLVRTFEATPAMLRAETKKRPPIRALVQHDAIDFVGAVNDQLPEALAVAFQLRGQRPWTRLDVFGVQDADLDGLTIRGRTGDALREARATAEAQLTALLPHLAHEASLHHYAVGPAFASYWDVDREGGFIHHSPRRGTDDVAALPYVDVPWEPGPRPAAFGPLLDALDAVRARAVRTAQFALTPPTEASP
ncbi:MAG: hypothetical protein H6733_03235 [Alphaproteobacteria bacterium]|nr:hypothetical protein [Alphaproteobacteria bacterium]